MNVFFLLQDVTDEMISTSSGTTVTVESFPFIDFDNSVLIVNLAKRAHSYAGRTVQVVHQGHETVDRVDMHEL